MNRFEEINSFVERAKKFTLPAAQENEEQEYLKRKFLNDKNRQFPKYKINQQKWEKTESGIACRKKRNSLKHHGGIKEFYNNRPPGCHVDHIIPLVFGGQHVLENLQYLPAVRNQRKPKYKITTDDKIALMRNRFIRKI